MSPGLYIQLRHCGRASFEQALVTLPDLSVCTARNPMAWRGTSVGSSNLFLSPELELGNPFLEKVLKKSNIESGTPIILRFRKFASMKCSEPHTLLPSAPVSNPICIYSANYRPKLFKNLIEDFWHHFVSRDSELGCDNEMTFGTSCRYDGTGPDAVLVGALSVEDLR